MRSLVFAIGGQHFVALHLGHLGAGEDLNTGLAVFLEQDSDDLLVEVRQDSWHGFNHSNGYAQFVVERSKLHTDDATAYDDHRFG